MVEVSGETYDTSVRQWQLFQVSEISNDDSERTAAEAALI